MSRETPKTAAASAADVAEVVAHLLRAKARLLDFLTARLGNRADAEDLLQQALLVLIEKGPSVRRGQSVVGWVHRVLRNLLVDAYRRRAARARLVARVQAEALIPPGDNSALLAEICACVLDVLKTLRPAYAEILRLTELEDTPVARVAGELGITAANAYVRLHRARGALMAGLRRVCGVCLEHGCFDCTCRRSGARERAAPRMTGGASAVGDVRRRPMRT